MGETTKNLFLHGDLEVRIIEATNLPNLDVLSAHLHRCFTLCHHHNDDDDDNNKNNNSSSSNPSSSSSNNKKDRNITHHRHIISSDAYVTVVVPQSTLARTVVISNAKNPKWDQRFLIPLAHPLSDLEFHVKDDDLLGAQLIGIASIPAHTLSSGDLIDSWFPILDSSGKQPKADCRLHLRLKFTPFHLNHVYLHGIAGDPEHKGVGNTYFPLRKGSSVTLYQDAHSPSPPLLPHIQLDDGKVYRQHNCWEDICHAISQAHHMIYIVGWSVYHHLHLIREPTRPLPSGASLSLGDLLKYKSEEGVRVLLLIWDDKTSHDKFGFSMTGVMQTHDEETRKFFKNSSVTCVLAPRYASSKLSIIKQQVVGTVFTHHQKCVLVDTQASGNDRKVTAFVGGIDLCDGRYDTPEHRLFRDLETVFKDDFHNPTFAAGVKAPRQPWHDLHARLDGPAAYDVLINFEQRWRKATKWREFGLFKRASHWHDDALIKIERISWILSPPLAILKDGPTLVPPDDPIVHVCKEDDPENWHTQIFRSIDSGSLKGFPKTIGQIEAQNLIFSKKLVIDKSIQHAYIQAIRSAQHFIYIENQYFLGASYGWSSYKNAGADNLIPMELALKIASKIRADERFAVYVVIPMWPEGDPKSEVVQEILYWQSQTMQMMYEVVARELKSKGREGSNVEDYLNFYCLGNREQVDQSVVDLSQASESYKRERFMIYVHAKGMIVDDEYVIVGSANINQRSMAGTKDTELAMGAYQPHHTWAAKKRHPRGQVYGYRASLWAEHLGGLDEKVFMEPESLECVKKVNSIAESNWERFNGEEFKRLQGHILKYPIHVDEDGKVGPKQEYECFPDVGGKVIGAQSMRLPDILTT